MSELKHFLHILMIFHTYFTQFEKNKLPEITADTMKNAELQAHKMFQMMNAGPADRDGKKSLVIDDLPENDLFAYYNKYINDLGTKF